MASSSDLITIDLAAERETVERYRLAWVAAKAEKDAILARAAADKSSPGHNYWEPEHAARLKYQKAYEFVSTLEYVRGL